MRTENHDILVIGSGIAGLSFALHCASFMKDKKVIVLSKGPLDESNTRYAQGGIAAVMDLLQDSYEKHIEDTLISGDGLCDKQVVEMVVKSAATRIEELVAWGVNFDGGKNQFDLAREGGHSSNRILHCKDHTGASITSVLLQRCMEMPNIELRESHFILELLQAKPSKEVLGALVCDEREMYNINASYTMLATGGAGMIYDYTSNPNLATGDGMALAIQAGAKMKNMAFVQFHPTVLLDDSSNPFLISEAVRGFGAVLKNGLNQEFMYQYDYRGSLATRDIVSRSIYFEMKKYGDTNVWLDLRHLDIENFKTKFPTINQRLEQAGIDVAKNMIPVKPAAHYFCGGVATDNFGQTSVNRLLACGEVAYTGLHGANRLASNSLLEALVFAHNAASRLKDSYIPLKDTLEGDQGVRCQCDHKEYSGFLKKVQQLMTDNVGIVRTDESLEKAHSTIKDLLNLLPKRNFSVQIKELQNILIVALGVIENSLQQVENKGAFYKLEFTEIKKAY